MGQVGLSEEMSGLTGLTTEACGGESAEPSSAGFVANTPPALRSLHGEVRRLHAALDAERFDRNYLQEELARTQHRLDCLGEIYS